MYQDLSTHHDWPLKNTVVNLPIRFKEDSKLISGFSLTALSLFRVLGDGEKRCREAFAG